jgi:hypothetical protein
MPRIPSATYPKIGNSMRCVMDYSKRLFVFHLTQSLFWVFVLGLNQGCIGKKEDTMPKGKPIHFTVIAAANLTPTKAEPDLVPRMDIEVGPQGYWIRSETGLKRLGYQWNDHQVNQSHNDVFQVTLGVQGTTGHAIKVLGVEQIADTVRILVSHIEPKGAVGEALTHPSTMLTTAKWPAKTHFELWIDGKLATCDWHTLD